MTGTKQKLEARQAMDADMPLYMRKTSHGYRFLRPVPQNLVAHLGRANFVKSLGKDYSEAKARCAELTVSTNGKLAEARAKQSQKNSVDAFFELDPNRRLKKVSVTKELSGQLGSLWLNCLTADAEARQAGLDDDSFRELSDNVAHTLPLIKRALASGQVNDFHNVVNQLLVFRGYQLDATDDEWQNLTYAVLQQIKVGYEIISARQNGDHLGPPDLSARPPPLSGAWEKNPNPQPQVKRLADISPLYKERLSKSDAKSQSTYFSIWQRFIDYSSNKPLDLIASADVFNFLESRLDAKEKPWSYKYASGRAKSVLREAFGLAKSLNLIASNPVDELDVLPKISKKEEEGRRKPRFPYKTNHLNILFLSDWYNPDSTNWRGKMKEDLGARYWIPLLCMWHGFRVAEATQLQIHDINLDSSTINIQATKVNFGPNRSVKNSATIRKIPIHPTLIELGFLEFVRSVCQNYKNGPLFIAALPEIGGSSPKWGRAYEQPFLRFMRDTLQFGNGYGNHSFRHALEDRIRAANLEQLWPEGLSRAYTGRATLREKDKPVMRGEGSEQDYGTGYEPSAILPYIRQITYPDVNLPPPFKTWLGNRKPVSKNLLALVARWKTQP